jgi:UDPglucose--hexose-1-phosphate uridylyltransferase
LTLHASAAPIEISTLPLLSATLAPLPADNYFLFTNNCGSWASERKRIIADDEQIVVFCPFAPRFAYETWILPKDHRASFEHSSDREITALAHSLRETLIRISRALDNPAFNYVVHSNPLDDIDSRHYHWHIEILPQVNQAAGFEWGSGCFINPVAPEDAAGLLRQVAF